MSIARQSNAIASVAKDGRILILFRPKRQRRSKTGVRRRTKVVKLRHAITHDQSPASALQWRPRNLTITTNKSALTETSANQLSTFLHLGTTSFGFVSRRRRQENARRKGGEKNASKPKMLPRRSRMAGSNLTDRKVHRLGKEKGPLRKVAPSKLAELN
jgi:hypothetical protein